MNPQSPPGAVALEATAYSSSATPANGNEGSARKSRSPFAFVVALGSRSCLQLNLYLNKRQSLLCETARCPHFPQSGNPHRHTVSQNRKMAYVPKFRFGISPSERILETALRIVSGLYFPAPAISLYWSLKQHLRAAHS